jgi:hypothetical protein
MEYIEVVGSIDTELCQWVLPLKSRSLTTEYTLSKRNEERRLWNNNFVRPFVNIRIVLAIVYWSNMFVRPTPFEKRSEEVLTVNPGTGTRPVDA